MTSPARALPLSSPRKKSRWVRRPARHKSITSVMLLFFVLLILPPGAMADTVTGYDPASMAAGRDASIVVRGSGFGDRRGIKCLRIGQGRMSRGVRLADPTDADWNTSDIRVRVPGSTAPGTYWISVYRQAVSGDCTDLVSGTPIENFVVRPGSMTGAVPTPLPPSVHAPVMTPAGSARGRVLRYNVDILVTTAKALDDCDNVSPGDWILFFGAAANSPDGTERARTSFEWPARGSRDVNTGSTIGINTLAVMGRLSGDESITLNTSGVDCDSDTWLPTGYLDRFSGSRQCGGEEFPEVSGANDSLGRGSLTLSPGQWTRGGAYKVSSRNGACGFDATFEVHVRPL